MNLKLRKIDVIFIVIMIAIAAIAWIAVAGFVYYNKYRGGAGGSITVNILKKVNLSGEKFDEAIKIWHETHIESSLIEGARKILEYMDDHDFMIEYEDIVGKFDDKTENII